MTTLQPDTATHAAPLESGALHRLIDARLRQIADETRKAAVGVELHLATSARGVERALRRAQAIVAVVSDVLPKHERRAIRQGLRDARAGLAPLARELAAVSQVQLDDAERAIAAAVIESAVVPSRDELIALVTAAAAQIATQVETLRALLSPAIEWSDVVAGVKSLYRDARRSRRAAKRSNGAFLRWARRTQQLVDVLAFLATAGAKVDVAELNSAIEVQHPVVEMIELRAFVRDHHEHVEHVQLLAALDARLEPAIAEARRAAKAAFARRPRQLARDLAPGTDEQLSLA